MTQRCTLCGFTVPADAIGDQMMAYHRREAHAGRSVASPFVQRALASLLPAKEITR